MVWRGRSDSPAVSYWPEPSALSPDTGLVRLISTPITQGFMGKQQPGPKVKMRKEGKAEEQGDVEVREDRVVSAAESPALSGSAKASSSAVNLQKGVC